MKNLRYLNKYLFKYKWYLLLGTIFIIFSNALGITIPVLVRESMDAVLKGVENRTGESEVLSAIGTFSLVMLGATLLKGTFMFFMRQTVIVCSRHIEYDLKNEVFLHYQSLPLAFYRRNKTGEFDG